MRTLAEVAYLDSQFGVESELPRAGTPLENPYVYDAAARDLKALAARGLVEITAESTRLVADEALIAQLHFKRLR